MLSRHPDHSPRPSCHCAARAFSFTSFTSFASLTSSKPFTIRTSKTPLPQLLYNPHLQAPLGSAGNKGLITLLESALTKRWGVGVGAGLRTTQHKAFHVPAFPLLSTFNCRTKIPALSGLSTASDGLRTVAIIGR